MLANMTIRRHWAIFGLVAIAGLAVATTFIAINGFSIVGADEGAGSGCVDKNDSDEPWGNKHNESFDPSDGGTWTISGTKLGDNIDCSAAHHKVVMRGGHGNDTLTGSPQDFDHLAGGHGDDTLNGLAGDNDTCSVGHGGGPDPVNCIFSAKKNSPTPMPPGGNP